MNKVVTATGNPYSLQDVFSALASAATFEDVLDRILEVALRELDADEGSILLLEGPEARSLKMLASRGLPPEILQRGYVPREGSISEFVLLHRQPVIVNDEPPKEGTPPFRPLDPEQQAIRRTIVSAMCVPLIARGKAIGTMGINRTAAHREQFRDDELEMCAMLGSQAAIVIENRRLQEELMAQERLAEVGRTVASITHCVKNILTGVRGGLGLAELGIQQDDSTLIKTGFETLKRNAILMSNLVLDLLDYSKERQPIRQQFLVAEVVSHVVDTLGFKAQAAGVELHKEVTEGLSYFGDADQITRALMNLVSNAVEAFMDYGERIASDARRVTVSAWESTTPDARLTSHTRKKSDRWLSLQVADTGPGIPEEAKDRIWDMFFSTKGSRGTGVGLAVTRKMIEEHEGRIMLDTAPGAGTIFTISLPIFSGRQGD